MTNSPLSDQSQDDGLDRIMTIPNILSLVRICGIGLFAWLILSSNHRFAGACLLAGLGATDWVDGYVARRFHQVSTLGKIIDPVADRILFLVGITSILVVGAAPLWIGIVVLIREAIVSVVTIILASVGGSRIDVIWAGKAGTFALMFAFPGFLLASSWTPTLAWVEDISWIFAIAGLALSWFALFAYVPKVFGSLSKRSPRLGKVPE